MRRRGEEPRAPTFVGRPLSDKTLREGDSETVTAEQSRFALYWAPLEGTKGRREDSDGVYTVVDPTFCQFR